MNNGLIDFSLRQIMISSVCWSRPQDLTDRRYLLGKYCVVCPICQTFWAPFKSGSVARLMFSWSHVFFLDHCGSSSNVATISRRRCLRHAHSDNNTGREFEILPHGYIYVFYALTLWPASTLKEAKLWTHNRTVVRYRHKSKAFCVWIPLL